MKVGPTERIVLLSEVAPEVAAAVFAADDAGAGAGDGSGAGVAPAVPFLPDARLGLDFAIGLDIFLALSSVTMISPCCSAAALSSMLLSASDQVWPAGLQEQDGLNSWRKRKAFAKEV